MLPEEDFIEEICVKNGWDRGDELLEKNLRKYFEAEQKYNIPRNYNLLSNHVKSHDIFSSEHCPTAPSQMGLLAAAWENKKTGKELSQMGISTQAASPAKALRRRGFLFRVNIKTRSKNEENKTEENETVATRYIFRENKIDYREIIDFNPPQGLIDGVWMKLTKKERLAIRLEFNPDFMGIWYHTSEGEIDHRIPENVRPILGKISVPLTRASLLDGTWILHYQILSKPTNILKRSVCINCQKGKEIELPEGVSVFRSAYKEYFLDGGKGCDGCWWHDPLRPKNPHLLPKEDLEEAIKRQEEKVQKVIDRLNRGK
jgi:hypothetical protein